MRPGRQQKIQPHELPPDRIREGDLPQIGDRDALVVDGRCPGNEEQRQLVDRDAGAVPAADRKPGPQQVGGEPTISMTALLELRKDADLEMKAKLRLALLT